MQQLYKELGIHKITTSSYTPQADKAETIMKRLAQLLRAYCATTNKYNTWQQALQPIAFAHNASHHQALRMTPFEYVFAIKPRHKLSILNDAELSERSIPEIKQMRDIVRLQASSSGKIVANVQPFHINDLVYVRNNAL